MKQKSLTLGQSLGKYQALYDTFQVGTITKWEYDNQEFQVRLNSGEVIDSLNNVHYMKLKGESLYEVIGDTDPVGKLVGVYIVKNKEKDEPDVRGFLSVQNVFLFNK